MVAEWTLGASAVRYAVSPPPTAGHRGWLPLSAPGTMVLAGVEVSRLGLGTMSLTGRGTWGTPVDPVGARSLLRRAAELGVQLFDTADSYGPEVAENLVARGPSPL